MMMKGWKNNNDPWIPLQEQNKEQVPYSSEKMPDLSTSSSSTTVPTFLDEGVDLLTKARISQPPQNPLHSMIDSEHYIQSLERKLEKLKKKKENPSSRDIIDSLALLREDQMRNYVNSDSSALHSTDETDKTLTPSYMKRKLFPEMQAISAIEVAELVKEDFVEKSLEEISLNESNTDSECDKNSFGQEEKVELNIERNNET